MDFGNKKEKPIEIVKVKTTKNGLETTIDESSIYSLSDAKKAQLISVFNTLLYHLGAFDIPEKENDRKKKDSGNK